MIISQLLLKVAANTHKEMSILLLGGDYFFLWKKINWPK